MRRKGPRVRGEIAVPGDKSISHRAVLFASLADGGTRVRGFLDAEDTNRTIGMMMALGAKIERESREELRIEGAGLRGFSEPGDVIDAGNSGTTIRIGAGLLAAQPFLTVITGDPYLRRRPMARVILPLTRMGAKVWGREGDRFPPLCIRGGGLKGIRYEMPVASAQVKSALLLAGLYADAPVTVVEPLPTRDHTERMLAAMGASVSRDGATGHDLSRRPSQSGGPGRPRRHFLGRLLPGSRGRDERLGARCPRRWSEPPPHRGSERAAPHGRGNPFRERAGPERGAGRGPCRAREGDSPAAQIQPRKRSRP